MDKLKSWNWKMIVINIVVIIIMILMSIFNFGNDVAYIDIMLSLVYLILPIVTLCLLKHPNKARLICFILAVTLSFSMIILGAVWQGGLIVFFSLGHSKILLPLAIIGLVVTILTMLLSFVSWCYMINRYYGDVDEELKAFKTLWNIISISITIGIAIYTLGLDDKENLDKLTNFQWVFIPLAGNLVMHILSFLNGEYKMFCCDIVSKKKSK